MTPPGFLQTAWLVLNTDLRIEKRTGEATITALLFAALVLVIGAFALAESGAEPAAAGPALFWIAVGLSANLAVVRSWSRERDDAAFDGLLLAPVPRSAVLAGKTIGLAATLLVIEAALVLPAILFFRLPVLPTAGWILPAALLATLGIALLGSLFGAMVVGGTSADLLVGVAVYPLLVPLFLGIVEVSRAALLGGGWDEVSGWTLLLLAYDVAVGGGALWLFGHVVEE
jgi:heme exporter protein CcmB